MSNLDFRGDAEERSQELVNQVRRRAVLDSLRLPQVFFLLAAACVAVNLFFYLYGAERFSQSVAILPLIVPLAFVGVYLLPVALTYRASRYTRSGQGHGPTSTAALGTLGAAIVLLLHAVVIVALAPTPLGLLLAVLLLVGGGVGFRGGLSALSSLRKPETQEAFGRRGSQEQ